MKLTVIVSLIAAISAILAPLLTAVINNRHLIKIKRIELVYEKQTEVIENYIFNASKYVEHCGDQYREDFFKYQNFIYIYTPKSLWSKIHKLNAAIQDKDIALGREMLEDISKELSKTTLKF